MQVNISTFSIVTLGLIVLGACSNPSSTPTTTSPAPTQSAATQPTAVATDSSSGAGKTETAGNHGGQGGQVVEMGEYHLELITLNEGNGTHLDFYLQKGDNHETVPNATVTAQVEFPNGAQTAVDLKYDAAGKHYYAVIPNTDAGDYKVVVRSDIKGEKMNARYRFQR